MLILRPKSKIDSKTNFKYISIYKELLEWLLKWFYFLIRALNSVFERSLKEKGWDEVKVWENRSWWFYDTEKLIGIDSNQIIKRWKILRPFEDKTALRIKSEVLRAWWWALGHFENKLKEFLRILSIQL